MKASVNYAMKLLYIIFKHLTSNVMQNSNKSIKNTSFSVVIIIIITVDVVAFRESSVVIIYTVLIF